MADQEQSRISRQASDLLNNQLFQDSCARMTHKYCAEWLECSDEQEREKLHAKTQVLQDVLNDLSEIIEFGAGDGKGEQA